MLEKDEQPDKMKKTCKGTGYRCLWCGLYIVCSSPSLPLRLSESWSPESSVYHYKHSGVNLTITRKEILQMNVLAGCLVKKALAEILVYRTSSPQLCSTC